MMWLDTIYIFTSPALAAFDKSEGAVKIQQFHKYFNVVDAHRMESDEDGFVYVKGKRPRIETV